MNLRHAFAVGQVEKAHDYNNNRGPLGWNDLLSETVVGDLPARQPPGHDRLGKARPGSGNDRRRTVVASLAAQNGIAVATGHSAAGNHRGPPHLPATGNDAKQEQKGTAPVWAALGRLLKLATIQVDSLFHGIDRCLLAGTDRRQVTIEPGRISAHLGDHRLDGGTLFARQSCGRSGRWPGSPSFLVDGRDAGIAQMLGGAGFDEAHAAMHLHAERGDVDGARYSSP